MRCSLPLILLILQAVATFVSTATVLSGGSPGVFVSLAADAAAAAAAAAADEGDRSDHVIDSVEAEAADSSRRLEVGDAGGPIAEIQSSASSNDNVAVAHAENDEGSSDRHQVVKDLQHKVLEALRPHGQDTARSADPAAAIAGGTAETNILLEIQHQVLEALHLDSGTAGDGTLSSDTQHDTQEGLLAAISGSGADGSDGHPLANNPQVAATAVAAAAASEPAGSEEQPHGVVDSAAEFLGLFRASMSGGEEAAQVMDGAGAVESGDAPNENGHGSNSADVGSDQGAIGVDGSETGDVQEQADSVDDSVGVQLLNNVVAALDVLEFDEDDEEENVAANEQAAAGKPQAVADIAEKDSSSSATDGEGRANGEAELEHQPANVEPDIPAIFGQLRIREIASVNEKPQNRTGNLHPAKAAADAAPSEKLAAKSQDHTTAEPDHESQLAVTSSAVSKDNDAYAVAAALNISESDRLMQAALVELRNVLSKQSFIKLSRAWDSPVSETNTVHGINDLLTEKESAGADGSTLMTPRLKFGPVFSQIHLLADLLSARSDTAGQAAIEKRMGQLEQLLSRTRKKWVDSTRGRQKARAQAEVKSAVTHEADDHAALVEALAAARQEGRQSIDDRLFEVAHMFVAELARRDERLEVLEAEAAKISDEFGSHLAQDAILSLLGEGAGVDYKSGKVKTGIKRDKKSQDQPKAIAKAISDQNKISAAISKRLMDPAVIAVNFQFLVDLAVLLSMATILAVVCEALKLPVVFSQVLTGMVVGPSGLNLLDDVVPIYTFSQFGSILFLLNFGLDHDVGLLSAAVAAPPTNRRGNGGLRRADAAFSQGGASICLLMSHKAVFHVVSHGLVATSVLAVVMVVLGLTSSWSEAILLAFAYSISATSVKKLRQLRRAGPSHSHPGFQQHLVRMLTAQNVVMGLLLAVPYAVASGFTFLYYVVGYVIVFFLASRFVSASLVSRVTSGLWQRTPEAMRGGWIVASTLVGSLMFKRFHMPLEFGAIFIGLIFTQTAHRDRIREIVEPLANVLGSIYFLCVGMVISIHWVWEHAFLLWVLVLSIATAKFVTSMGFVASTNYRVGITTALQATTFLAPTGEFSLLFIMRLKSVDLISRHSYLHVLSATAILIAFGPRVLRFLLRDICGVQPTAVPLLDHSESTDRAGSSNSKQLAAAVPCDVHSAWENTPTTSPNDRRPTARAGNVDDGIGRLTGQHSLSAGGGILHDRVRALRGEV